MGEEKGLNDGCGRINLKIKVRHLKWKNVL
jgi:hypothetical protein